MHQVLGQFLIILFFCTCLCICRSLGKRFPSQANKALNLTTRVPSPVGRGKSGILGQSKCTSVKLSSKVFAVLRSSHPSVCLLPFPSGIRFAVISMLRVTYSVPWAISLPWISASSLEVFHVLKSCSAWCIWCISAPGIKECFGYFPNQKLSQSRFATW